MERQKVAAAGRTMLQQMLGSGNAGLHDGQVKIISKKKTMKKRPQLSLSVPESGNEIVASSPSGPDGTGLASPAKRLAVTGKSKFKNKLGLNLCLDADKVTEAKPKHRGKLGLNLSLSVDDGEAGPVHAFASKRESDMSAAELNGGPARLRDDCVKVRKLGRGAGGIVYLGIYVPTLSLVAIKDVSVADETHEQMVMQELDAIHQNLIPLNSGEAVWLFHHHESIGDVHPCEYVVSFYGS